MASINDNCNGKPNNMNTLRSFKVSALKIPAKVGQKEDIIIIPLFNVDIKNLKNLKIYNKKAT